MKSLKEKDSIIFKLSKKEMFEFLLPAKLNNLSEFNFIRINLISGQEIKEILTDYVAIWAFRCLKVNLEELLRGGRALPVSIEKDISSLCEGKLFGNQGQKFLFSKIFSVWKGKNTITWLYEKNGTYYIEITPIYPWLTDKEKKSRKHQTFDQFKKNYKSCIAIAIDKSTAEELLKIIKKVIKILENNYNKLKN